MIIPVGITLIKGSKVPTVDIKIKHLTLTIFTQKFPTLGLGVVPKKRLLFHESETIKK